MRWILLLGNIGIKNTEFLQLYTLVGKIKEQLITGTLCEFYKVKCNEKNNEDCKNLIFKHVYKKIYQTLWKI